MKKRVLIADDDAAITDVVSIVLTDAGYDVVHEKRGESVIKSVEKYNPHMVLLDIWLSGANGGELVKTLKGEKTTKSIPVVLMSANSDTENIAKKSGADGFLAKPFNISELITIVEKHCGN